VYEPGAGARRPRAAEGRPLEDAELVQRAKAGDIGAFEQLVRHHQAISMRVAYLAARGAADVEDVVQEAFVKAYLALDRFRDGAPFRPWLLRIVANEASNSRRAAGRRSNLALRLAARDRVPEETVPSPEAAILQRSDRAALLTALNHLRDVDRRVIGYRYLLGLSDAETAQVLGWPIGTVKSRGTRALRRLRAVLPPGSFDVAAAPSLMDGKDG
jgi:RNA polymerase sigma factor (sigma-70 family)